MRVCLISARFREEAIRLQPCHYLYQICQGLQQEGVEVKVISDGYPSQPKTDAVAGIPVERLNSVRTMPVGGSRSLLAAIAAQEPDVVLWHVGLTSMLHLDLTGVNKPVVAVFTSPIYDFKDFLPLRMKGLLTDPVLVWGHLLGCLAPPFMVRRVLQNRPVRAVIVLSAAVKQALIRRGVSADRITLIPPGIDEAWLKVEFSQKDLQTTRQELGIGPEEFVVVYFGAPSATRGTDTLLEAIALSSASLPNLKLLLLSRRQPGELSRAQKRLMDRVARLGISTRVKVVSGFLAREELMRVVSAADVVTLPFKLVPADGPLTVLEAMARGKPVVATAVDGLPEVLGDGRGVLVRPNNADDLAQALVNLGQQPELVRQVGSRAKAYARARDRWPETAHKLLQIVIDQ